MPSTRPNTITLHLNTGDPQWGPESSPGIDWETRFADFCSDNTRQNIPAVGEIGELPWSPGQGFNNQPLENMTGVRFEPLGGTPVPEFLLPFYDWGVRAVYFGSVQFNIRLPGAPGSYLELLFDTPEARQTFMEVFGTDIEITRTGMDRTGPTDPIPINEQREYGITRSDTEFFSDETIWGDQTFYMLSWREIPSPDPSIIDNVVDSRLQPLISSIIDIEFISTSDSIDIMGECGGQSINPCQPVVPPECVVDSDCPACNGKCVFGTCTCEDCPCHSVCFDPDIFNDSLSFVPREFIGDDQENCDICDRPGTPIGGNMCFCLQAQQSGAVCRPERGQGREGHPDDQGREQSCDCQVGQVCCTDDLGESKCCQVQDEANAGATRYFTCVQGEGCLQTECLVDSECGECKECVDDDTPGFHRKCRSVVSFTECSPGAGTRCEWCVGGECQETGVVDCNCEGQECPAGEECCEEGHCCEIALGGCNGSGCNQCDDDGDCIARLNDPCAKCVGGECQIIDCEPCERTDPTQNCACVEGLVCLDECKDCVADADGNEECIENCTGCQECDEDGVCGDPDPCPSGLVRSPAPACICIGECEDCEILVDNGEDANPQFTCEVNCGCCDNCSEPEGSSGGVFCNGPNNGNCPVGQFCEQNNNFCQCRPIPTCDPPCTGDCSECLVLNDGAGNPSSAFCVSRQEDCAFCETCTGTAGLPNHNCQPNCDENGDCCADESCCPAGEFCCNDADMNCCPVGGDCCGGGVCCPAGQFCCDDGSCCPNGKVCCPNGGCCDSASECCDNGDCCKALDCQKCRNGKCTICPDAGACRGCDGNGFCSEDNCPDPCEFCNADGDCEVVFTSCDDVCAPPDVCSGYSIPSNGNCVGRCFCESGLCQCSDTGSPDPACSICPLPLLETCIPPVQNPLTDPGGGSEGGTPQSRSGIGACCLQTGMCVEANQSNCNDSGGTWFSGDCNSVNCNQNT